MAFNEDNVTEQMCIEVAKQAGYEYCSADELREAKNDVIVERLDVVNDIDKNVVDIVRRFSNAFKTVTGQNEVRKMLRTILWLKYKIKDNEVFEKAYKYVEMYYTPATSGLALEPKEHLLSDSIPMAAEERA